MGKLQLSFPQILQSLAKQTILMPEKVILIPCDNSPLPRLLNLRF